MIVFGRKTAKDHPFCLTYKQAVIRYLRDSLGVGRWNIVLLDYPKWSVYFKNNEIHSFDFNAIQRGILYNYLKGELI